MEVIEKIIKENVEIIDMNFNSAKIFPKLKIDYEISCDFDGCSLTIFYRDKDDDVITRHTTKDTFVKYLNINQIIKQIIRESLRYVECTNLWTRLWYRDTFKFIRLKT